LNAATEQYGKEGHDFSERGAQRLLAGVAQGFAKEMDTAEGIMMGMGVDSTLSETQITDRLGVFYEELEDGVQAAMDAHHVITKNLTDAERKKLIDQKVEFTELTDEQRKSFADQMQATAMAMAQSGKEFSAENKKTLIEAILSGFQTQDALNKLRDEKGAFWMAMHGDTKQGFMEDDKAYAARQKAVLDAASKDSSMFGGVGAGIGNAVGKLAGGVGAAGMAALEATAGGLKAGAPLVGDAIGTALGQIVEYLPKKGKPKTGKGEVVNVADGGVQVMAEIARGMVEGTTIMVTAMHDAMLKVKEELYLGIVDIYNTMADNFEFIGRRASQAFTTGVILEQRLDIGALKQQLTDLLLGEFASEIKVVDVSGETGAATLSVDSVKTLSGQISGMKDALLAELKAIKTATENTAENTKPLKGNVGIAFIAQTSK